MPRHSFWSGLAVIGFALLALNWIIPNYAGVNPFAQMPPDLVPRIASWIMLVSGIIVVVQASVEMARAGQKPISLDIDWADLGWKLWPFAYVAVAIYFLTFMKITHVGVPMIAGMLFLLGERRWYILIGCSVVPVVLLYFLSVYMMRVGVI
ncbi:MAG: tripartite tricarboxylate transporter TctB family protein [Salinarimonas sp.]